jgi:hypothetical protein
MVMNQDQDDGFLASDSLAVYCSARCATGD